VGEQVVAQLVLDLATDADEGHARAKTGQPLESDDGDQCPRVEPQLALREVLPEVIDGVAQHPRGGRGERRGGNQVGQPQR
jgi:hypothetical protein